MLIQTVFLGGGEGEERENGPMLCWVNVLLLDIF